MGEVGLNNVSKHFGEFVAVKNVSFTAKEGELLVLVGPSGCGKTSTLRMIAGLEEITDGEIYIDGVLVNELPPRDRNIAMVFQNYALYPHMSAYDNMAFALELRHLPKEEIKRRVSEAVEILGIGDLLRRKPKELSGGERQRVAMGRAIVREPKVFLFDEPLSNLDAKLRVQMRVELNKLHERLETTMIYVTHDQVEAMTLADRIIVMNNAEIMQVGSPREVYENPQNLFVAGFIGSPSMNFLPARVIKEEDTLVVDVESFRLPIPQEFVERFMACLDREVVFAVRPEHLYDASVSRGFSTTGMIKGVVEVCEFLGSEAILFVQTGKHHLTARIEEHGNIKPHQEIELIVNMDKMHIFDPASGASFGFSP
jgi:multiple sugar transport system ATP-binding protein